MLKETVTYKNDIPFHIRPISIFINIAKQSDCEVTLTKGETTIAANSTMRLLQLCVSKNDQVTISVEGKDEEQVLKSLVDVILDD